MITKEMSVIDTLNLIPAAREIFEQHGMNCISCMGSTTESIADAARAHDVNIADLLAALNNAAK